MSTDTLQSRPATAADLETVLGLMRDFYAEDHLVFDELIARRALHDLFAHPSLGTITLLLHPSATGDEASIVGHFTLTYGFSLEFHGRFALLDELYLIPSVRGRGWGRQSLTLASTAARAQGVIALRLEVNQANARARSVYLKAGFQDNRRDLFTQWLR